MVVDDDVAALKCALDYQLALVGNGQLTKESFKSVQKRAKELINEIVNLVQPWEAKSTDGIRNSEVEQLIDTYKRLVGDPNDPAFQRKMKEAEKVFAARTKVVKKEAPEDKLSRRLREKEAKKRNQRKTRP